MKGEWIDDKYHITWEDGGPTLKAWFGEESKVAKYGLKYEKDLDSGMDLRAELDRPFTLWPMRRFLMPTGLHIALPWGHEGQVRPRSGLAIKCGITVLNAPGTIDEGYRGEILVPLINLGTAGCTINPGDRIAQLVIAPVARVQVQVVDSLEELGETERGEGGFGSTGND